MSDRPVQEQDLRALEIRVEELIRVCAHLKDENKILRAELEQLSAERDQLMRNHAAARVRVESLIERMKVIEAAS